MHDFIDRIVETYSGMIFRIAFLHTRKHQDAEDIMQEVFLSLLKPPRFNGEEHLKAWIIRVTLNKCKNFLKSQKRRRAVSLDAGVNIGGQTDEERTELLDALHRLPETDRNILFLHYYEGYTAKEIAKFLGGSENAVFIRLNRARDKLKADLEP